mmetsp:Transcript_16036/g.51184  ORF Transcript_16036/g.51184 Transcript_16036/m.51184 type:complete len:223 (+) Transcript_16036:709-1377(+)
MWQPTEPSTEPCGAASAQPAPSLAAASAASPQFTTRVSLSSPAPPTRRPNSRMYSRTAAATAASRRGRKPAAVPSAACSSAAPPPPAASIEPTDAAVRSTCVSHSKTLVPPPLVRAVVYAPFGTRGAVVDVSERGLDRPPQAAGHKQASWPREEKVLCCLRGRRRVPVRSNDEARRGDALLLEPAEVRRVARDGRPCHCASSLLLRSPRDGQPGGGDRLDGD